MKAMNWCLTAMALVLVAIAAYGEGKAQGFIVLKQGAPLYKTSNGDKVIGNADKDEAMVGYGSSKLQSDGWVAETADGRVHVMTLIPDGPNSKVGTRFDGWISQDDVVQFSYECGCGIKKEHDIFSKDDDGACGPFVAESGGGVKAFLKNPNGYFRWNICFEDGKSSKVAAMSSPQPAAQPSQSVADSVEERLKKLEDLKKKGLITQDEYDKKRAEILKNF